MILLTMVKTVFVIKKANVSWYDNTQRIIDPQALKK